MRKMLVITMALLMGLCFIYGCGKKETKEEDKVPAETKQAEMADSTAMDSASWDEGEMDSMGGAHEHDSM